MSVDFLSAATVLFLLLCLAGSVWGWARPELMARLDREREWVRDRGDARRLAERGAR